MAQITYADKSNINVNPTVPAVNKVQDTDLNEIKTVVNTNTPPGLISIYSGSSVPTGWLICDGSAISRTIYSSLFSVIGSTYGSGDGSTTFNLPNLKGKVAVGLDSSDTDFDTLGETGGSKYLQKHSHKTTTDPYAKALSVSTTGAEAFSASGTDNYRRNTNLSSDDTGTAGTGNSGNLQPYIVFNYIISY